MDRSEAACERGFTTTQAVSITHAESRFKIAHAITDELEDTASMAVFDTESQTGMVMNLYPLGDETRPLRFCVELVLVEGDGRRKVLYEDVVYEPEDK